MSGNIIQQATRTLLPQQHQTGNLICFKWSANWKHENSTYDNFCFPKLCWTISGIITLTCFHFVASAIDWGGRYLRSAFQQMLQNLQFHTNAYENPRAATFSLLFCCQVAVRFGKKIRWNCWSNILQFLQANIRSVIPVAYFVIFCGLWDRFMILMTFTMRVYFGIWRCSLMLWRFFWIRRVGKKSIGKTHKWFFIISYCSIIF